MNFIYDGKNTIIKEPESFVLSQTFECGQCFRFEKLAEEHYITVANGRLLEIKQRHGDIVLYGVSEEEFEGFWKNYFDLNRDYPAIKSILERDETLNKAVKYASGIRILNQEFFECLISFIISQNNRIPMIKKVIKNLSQKYGSPVGEYNGEVFYSFPTAESMLGASQEELMECKTGFRWKYITDAVNMAAEGRLEYRELSKLPTVELKERLMEIKGVGTKVADCVLLFSCGRSEVFPTDVWVKRVMSELYFGGQPADVKAIHARADELFGEYAGFAQQYLFNYARDNKIGA